MVFMRENKKYVCLILNKTKYEYSSKLGENTAKTTWSSTNSNPTLYVCNLCWTHLTMLISSNSASLLLIYLLMFILQLYPPPTLLLRITRSSNLINSSNYLLRTDVLCPSPSFYYSQGDSPGIENFGPNAKKAELDAIQLETKHTLAYTEGAQFQRQLWQEKNDRYLTIVWCSNRCGVELQVSRLWERHELGCPAR